MKIIKADNFSRDTVSEILIAENVSPLYSLTIVDALNAKYGGEQAQWYFCEVPDDHKLYVWEP